MIDLLHLSEMENEDVELVPEILAVDARLSFQAEADGLASMLQSALEVVPNKEIIPNTGYVLIEGLEQSTDSASHVKISATDGERSITLISSAASVKLSGSTLVPGKRVLDILRLARGGVVRIDILGTTMNIRAGRAVWTVTTPPTEKSLPTFSDPSSVSLYPVGRSDLLRGLESVYPAISKFTARQALMQVQVKQGNVTSCDGVRAHRVSVAGLSSLVDTTMPLKFVETAIKELKSHTDEVVEIGANDSTVVLHFGDNILMSQKLNFEYPNVDHLMLGPAMLNDEILTVDTQMLSEAIKRVRVNSDPEYYALYLSLRKTQDGWILAVKARDKDANSSQETINVTYEGPANAKDLVVNHRHLLEFLSCINKKEVQLKLGVSTKTKQAPIYVSEDSFTGTLMVMSPNFVK